LPNHGIFYPQVVFDDFNFYKYDQPTLQALEESCCFPPRFVVSYSRDDPTIKLHSTIILEEVKVMFPVDYENKPLNGIGHFFCIRAYVHAFVSQTIIFVYTALSRNCYFIIIHEYWLYYTPLLSCGGILGLYCSLDYDYIRSFNHLFYCYLYVSFLIGAAASVVNFPRNFFRSSNMEHLRKSFTYNNPC